LKRRWFCSAQASILPSKNGEEAGMSHITTPPLGLASHVAAEDDVFRKIAWRLVPFLFLCYLAAYLDRVNVGFAKLQMQNELSFSETVYGFGAGIFFLGYVLFEVPSNIILHKVGARLWLARVMVTWAFISAGMAFVRTPTAFYIMRFLLGVAEAGFIPGVLLYLTYWFPAARRGRITALFLTAIPMASIFGGPLSGWILGSVSGTYGYSGWQWLFLVEAAPSLVFGVAILFYLDNSVKEAKWLDPDEKQMVAAIIAGEQEEKEGLSELRHAFVTPRVWLLGAAYFCIASGIYIVSFWLPTIIKKTGVADPLTIGLLTAIPYLVAVVSMVTVCGHGDRTKERRWHTAAPAVACALGLAITAAATGNTIVAIIGLTLAAAGASTSQASFWTLPASFLGGAAAAAGIALVNSLGNVAGFASTYVVGWLADLTHSNVASLYLFGGLVLMGAILVLLIPPSVANK
jgi:D-galactonate transporter